MVSITNTTQLSTFSIIRAVIVSNTVISSRFSISDFYEFEPKHKSSSFKGFPYIIIEVPTTDDVDDYLGDILVNRNYTVNITLRMDYLARDNFSSYASQILKELDNANSVFQANGFYMESCSFDGSDVTVIDQKELVEGRFTLILSGEVS